MSSKMFVVALLWTVLIVKIQGLENLSVVQKDKTGWNTKEINKHNEELFVNRDEIDTSLEATEKSLSKLKKTVEEDFDADTSKRPLRLIKKLQKNWNNQGKDEKLARGIALMTVVHNIGTIANAIDNPKEAIEGVLNLISSSLMVMSGPVGQIVGVAVCFITSFMGLFGSTKKPKPIREIMHEEIEEALQGYHDKVVKEEIDGLANTIKTLKTFLDAISQYRNGIADENLCVLFSQVHIFEGMDYMGRLRGRIETMIASNKVSDAKKCLRYLEIFLQMETMRDMMLMQMASLISTKSSAIAKTFYRIIEVEQKDNRRLLSFLYKSSEVNMITPYFDNQKYPITNAYMKTILKIPRPDHFPAPRYCLFNDGHIVDWYSHIPKVDIEMPHPYFGQSDDNACIWRIVSHGNNLFSIVNKFACPKEKWCDGLLSFDGSTRIATVEHEDPVLWEIKDIGGNNYRIIPRRFCGSNCGEALGYERKSFKYIEPWYLVINEKKYKWTGCLGCSLKLWKIYKPSSDMPSVGDDSGSTTEPVTEKVANEESGNSSTSGDDDLEKTTTENHLSDSEKAGY